LGDRELNKQHAAVAQHHDKKTQPAMGGPHLHRTKGAPIDLGAFTRGKRELQKGLGPFGPHFAHILFDNGIPAAKALFTYPLKDLYSGITYCCSSLKASFM